MNFFDAYARGKHTNIVYNNNAMYLYTYNVGDVFAIGVGFWVFYVCGCASYTQQRTIYIYVFKALVHAQCLNEIYVCDVLRAYKVSLYIHIHNLKI